MRGGCFNGSGLGLPMSEFLLLLVNVDQSRRSAPAGLLDRRPAVSARIRTIGIDRTRETSTDEGLGLV